MKNYYVPVPDNEYAFYAYVNLVINNKQNMHVVKPEGSRPKNIGPYRVLYTRNEVGEPFIVTSNLKEKCFVEMVIDQFTLLRTYWNTIQENEQYSNSNKYDI